MSDLRAATFNIRHGETNAGAIDLRLLVRTCRDLDADLLALQEVDRFMRRTRWANIARRVARGTGMAYAFGPALRTAWFGRYGNALLVRGRLSAVQVLPLPTTSAEPRSALLAVATTAGTAVSVAVTHLSVRREERDQQLTFVLGALSQWGLPRLLLGDLNGPLEDVAPLIEAGALRPVRAGPTFPALAPEKQIDHVAVRDRGAAGAAPLSPPRAPS
jgi:endonuclease/exonuclease/phosphatase family metal-dependent hydrolase